MPCSVCIHDKREEIEAAIVTPGRSVRSVAAEFDLGKDAVHKHRRHHLPASLATVAVEREQRLGTSVLDRVESLIGDAEEILAKAKEDGRHPLALQAMRELRASIELLAKVTGELREAQTSVSINVLQAPEWLRIQTAILDTLQPFPEARTAIAARLMQLEGPS